MHITYHFESSDELNQDFLDSIKAAFKSGSIKILVTDTAEKPASIDGWDDEDFMVEPETSTDHEDSNDEEMGWEEIKDHLTNLIKNNKG